MEPADLAQQYHLFREQMGKMHPGLSLDQAAALYSTQSDRKSSKRKSSTSHVPRSSRSKSNSDIFVSTQATSMHDISQATADMNRHYGMSVQSAPAGAAAIPLSRDASSSYSGSAINSWQNNAAPFNGYKLQSASNNTRSHEHQKQNHHIEGRLQTPPQFIASLTDTSPRARPNYTTVAIPEQTYYDPNFLSATSSNFAWSPPSDSPITSPSIYSNDFTSSAAMSRNPTNGSCSSGFNQLHSSMSMLRMNSSSFKSENSDLSPSLHHQPQFLDHSPTNLVSPHYHQSFDSSFTFDPTSIELSSNQSYVTPMQRSDSNQTTSSTSSNKHTRSTQRHHETVHQSQKRPIAAAPVERPSGSHKSNMQSGVKMERMTSQNGEQKLYAVIPQQPDRYKRPSMPKLFCNICSDQPEGFRGEHELTRHMSRAHPEGTRKVWVCIDSSADQKFLANCKACRTKKKYGAYYNAAAHLRRAHFNPRKRGRKSKQDSEKRGGKGGGNWPPMDQLKDKWMCEVVEEVPEHTVVASSDADADEADEEEEHDDHDPTHAEVFDVNDLNLIGASFETSLPANGFIPAYAHDDMNFNFDTLDAGNYAADVLIPQGTSMYGIESSYFDVGMNNYPNQQQYEVGGQQMWAPQS